MRRTYKCGDEEQLVKMVDDKRNGSMWVEELSDAARPLGGFTHVCNECDSCRIGIHHSELLGKVLPYISHSLSRMWCVQGHRHRSFANCCQGARVH